MERDHSQALGGVKYKEQESKGSGGKAAFWCWNMKPKGRGTLT